MSEAPTRWIDRIAIVGGASYSEPDLIVFLEALYSKYPDATVVIGSALRSCEQLAADKCFALGFTVERPEVNHSAFGDEALLCQVNDVVKDADVVVTVGAPSGGRAKRAVEILKRVDSCRETWNKRALHNVAAPAKKAKAAPVRRAKKKAREYA